MTSGAGTERRPTRVLVLVLGIAALVALPAIFVGLRVSAAQAPPEELSNTQLLTRVARAADEPPQFGATVTVEQDLLPTQLLDSMAQGGGSGGSPSLSSAPQTARVWYGGEDRARAELLGENGDRVFVKNGERVAFYDGSTNTVRSGQVPEGPGPDGSDDARGAGEAVSPAEVNDLLAEVGETSNLSQGETIRFEGRQAYVLTLTPKDPGSTLVGRAQALIDSETYLPLRFLLFADGAEEPVLSYDVSDFDAGPVPAERFRLQTPPGAEVRPLEDGRGGPEGPEGPEGPSGRGGEDFDGGYKRAGGMPGGEPAREVAGVEEARGEVDFGVRQLGEAPGGRALEGTYLTRSGGVALTYGSGWGTVVLSQEPGERGSSGGVPDEIVGTQLPTVNLGGGVQAQEFSTPVGTALIWSDGGVSYTLAGSVPAPELERAARALR